LSRSPEDVRADGGIAKLWATAGGPSVEIQEIDYAEILREAGARARDREIPRRGDGGTERGHRRCEPQKLREIISDRSGSTY
jgi:hypothetical protein